MARERYLVGAGEDTIHTGVIELKTAKQKRANWWYYNKVRLLIGAVLLAIAVSIVYSIVTRPQPDYTIGLVTSFNMPDAIVTQLEDELARYGEDRNGNGKVEVDVACYVFTEMRTADDLQAQQANFARLTGDAVDNTCMVYIIDEEAMELVAGDFVGFFQYNDGSPMPEEALDYENAMRPWKDFKALAGFEPDVSSLTNWTPEVLEKLFSRLYVLVRTPEDTAFAQEEKGMAYYNDSLEMLERLETGEAARAN